MSTEENQFNVQGYNIVTILKRLESATSRLEDITIFQEEANRLRNEQLGKSKEGVKQHSIVSNTSDSGVSSKLIESQTSGDSNGSKGEAKVEEDPKSLVEFDEIVKHKVEPFVKISQEIDETVGKSAQYLLQAFKEQRKFLTIANKSKKPEANDANFGKIIEPINNNINKIVEIKDENRKSSFFNHLNTIGEGSPVLGWILTDTPVSYIPEYKDSAKFWSDRVLKEFKGKDDRHLQWVKQFSEIFDELKDYVKKYYTTGPWNAQGKNLGDVIETLGSSEGIAEKGKTSGGSAPPPPPPPPPADFYSEKSAPSGGINAVFADLNKGEAITSGLRKVDKSEMTHKNPELRQNKKPVPPKKPTNLSSNSNSSSNSSVPIKKPARKELIDGTKWIIENYSKSDANEPITIDAEMSQSIFIGNCQDITIQIKGKANAISVSDTKNIGVVIDSLVSGLDVIRSFKFGIQVVDIVPMINIDKSDEGNLYISQKSIDCDIQIFSSCSTALNVNIPENDDFKELSIPEQFLHKINNGKLTSEVVEHAG